MNDPNKKPKTAFVNIKLKRNTIKGMIETYEFLKQMNISDYEERKHCQRILKALNKSLL